MLNEPFASWVRTPATEAADGKFPKYKAKRIRMYLPVEDVDYPVEVIEVEDPEESVGYLRPVYVPPPEYIPTYSRVSSCDAGQVPSPEEPGRISRPKKLLGAFPRSPNADAELGGYGRFSESGVSNVNILIQSTFFTKTIWNLSFKSSAMTV